MRIPVDSFRETQSIEVIRYGPSSDESLVSRSTVDFEADDMDIRWRNVKLRYSKQDVSLDSADEAGSCYASIAVPSRISRRSRARGWERLVVESSGRSTSPGSLAAWLVWPDNRSTDEPPSILITTQPDMANHMGSLASQTPWQDLALLGTHDSCAFFGYPYAQCQQPATSITQQLIDGVRFLDLRMRVIHGELIMYHGIRSQRARFTSVLDEIHTFLSSHPSESILVSIKEEVPPLHPDFASLVWDALSPHVDKFWYLETRLPTLGEVRGKAMLMPRFPIPEAEPGMWDKGVGLQLESWPDDRPEGFELDCGADRVRVQDWYGVPSFLRIPEKLQAVTDHLGPTITDFPIVASVPEKRPLTISYLSAATIPLAPPCALAKGFGWPSIGLGVEGLNSRFIRWLLQLMCDGRRIRGIVPVDFYAETGDIAGLLVAMNQMGLSESTRIPEAMSSGRPSVDTVRTLSRA